MLARIVKGKQRCDYCHLPHDRNIIVDKGDCTGTFCSKFHWELAKQAMDTQQIPEHEKESQ